MVPSDSEDGAVRAVESAYDRAWCSGDVGSLLRCMRSDAVLINPRGEVAHGSEEIGEALGGFVHGEAAGSTHESHVERVTFVRDDVAVVDGRAFIRGGGLIADVEHRFTDVLVREGGRWLISQVRAYALDAR